MITKATARTTKLSEPVSYQDVLHAYNRFMPTMLIK